MIFFFIIIFFNDVMRGSNLLVTVQIRGMIKEEEKRNRSPPVLIFGGWRGDGGGDEGVNM